MSLGITATNLRLDYGDTRALDDLSFDLDGGKIYGLLGRNGSGKTSLLSIIAAFRQQTGGHITVDGRAPFENAAVTSQICLIRESGDVFDTASVNSALKFAADFRPYWDADLAARLIDRFEVPLKKRVQALSRGKRSALGVILGLASRAPVTLFDEVHLGMDAPSRYAFYEELLNDYLEHPRTVVLSTHLIEEVASLFEEVIIIDRGRLILHEPADEVRDRGVAITGRTDAVENFTRDMEVLSTKQLGGTSQATVYGALSDENRRAAVESGLELGPVPLQDLFVHLTDVKRGNR
ncbi:ABC-2 type transport system ATP-binding protein [Stackebrandtia endophytica]|uniref:ABC-2 type transport system ATP-binding protein n=1 Tax=Stackebrandtia endophytica TaxID=1496996 RepID=A0A543AQL6_9ACTN|nr:ABC transporter ATP-binding protein [Stackebrandtia endophytica]TQL74872.1 ABC-2 type transport system ATP-binding protein [Stackebrandtia endophytica]